MHKSITLLLAAMPFLLAMPLHAGPEVARISIYLDDPAHYVGLQTRSVIVSVENYSEAPIRSLDYAGFRLWRIGPAGEWIAPLPKGPEIPPAPDPDPDPNLATLTLEIASADLLSNQRPLGMTISRGIGYVTIDPHRQHLYCVDVDRYLSQPGQYSLRAVLTRNDQPIAQSPVRSLRIAPAPKAGRN